MIKKEEILILLEELVSNKNIIKHMLATEAVMGELYDFLSRRGVVDLGGTKEEWMMAGLLHDGDYNPKITENRQGIEITNILRRKGLKIPENVAYTMAAHNKATGILPKTLMDWALFISDSLTGLIVATALVRPDKKLASVTVDLVLKKFKDKDFARGTRRKDILLCQEKLGISLEEFIKIALLAMQSISSDLGL